MPLTPLRQRAATALRRAGQLIVPSGPVHNGTTTAAGTTSTVVDATTHAAFSAVGRRLVMLAGPAAGETAKVTADDGTTYTVKPALSAGPGAGNAYRITK